MNTTLLDSNVIIYAINSASPKNVKAQNFIQSHATHLALAHQNIFESLRVLTHHKFPSPMTPASALRAINAIAGSCRIISPGYAARETAAALIQKHKLSGDKVFDAYLAATASSVGINSIATDNTKDFAMFEGITVTNPFKSDLKT